MLRLRHLAPSGLLCFVFLEGAVVLGILLALAELVSWWGVVVLPVAVALMVKFNDLVAGTFVQSQAAVKPAAARASVLRPATMPAAGPSVYGSGVAGGHSAAASRSFHNEPGAAGQASEDPNRYGVSAPIDWRSTGYANAGFRSADPAAGAPEHPGAVNGPGGGAGPDRSGAMPVSGYARSGSVHGQSDGADNPAARNVPGGVPVRRAWAEQLDVRQQIARQSAVRRYE